MSAADGTEWTLTTAAAAIRARDVSPVEVTRACLNRIEERDAEVNAFRTVLHKQALSDARRAEAEILKGTYRGPLHGIPFGAKDLFLTKGIATTCGSRILANFVPSHDAELVARVKQAGGVLLGKLNMHEFAFGTTSENPHYGPVRNPVDRARISGGSSGGSAAAVAMSFVLFALGTDTGGSIRIPAALCGIAGLKPTYGRLSRRGVYPLCWSLDHPGPMARTVADLALAMDVLGPAPASTGTTARTLASTLPSDLDGIKIGVPDSYFFDRLEPDVAASIDAAIKTLRSLGATFKRISIPFLAEAASAAAITLFGEAAASLEKWHRTRAGELGADVRMRLDIGAAVTAAQYLKAQRVRTNVRREFAKVFQRVDALVTPQLPITAPAIGQREITIGAVVEPVPDALTRLTRIFNLIGVPSLSVPCRRSREGLPIALQVAARANNEQTVLRIGHAYEHTMNRARVQ